MDRAASVAIGVAMMGVTYAIYDTALPAVVDQRAAPMNEPDSTSAEKTARWAASALVIGVSLITWDATVFILGASSVIAFSWMYRHANMGVNPNSPAGSTPASRQTVGAEVNVGQASVGAQVGINY